MMNNEALQLVSRMFIVDLFSKNPRWQSHVLWKMFASLRWFPFKIDACFCSSSLFTPVFEKFSRITAVFDHLTAWSSISLTFSGHWIRHRLWTTRGLEELPRGRRRIHRGGGSRHLDDAGTEGHGAEDGALEKGSEEFALVAWSEKWCWY